MFVDKSLPQHRTSPCTSVYRVPYPTCRSDTASSRYGSARSRKRQAPRRDRPLRSRRRTAPLRFIALHLRFTPPPSLPSCSKGRGRFMKSRVTDFDHQTRPSLNRGTTCTTKRWQVGRLEPCACHVTCVMMEHSASRHEGSWCSRRRSPRSLSLSLPAVSFTSLMPLSVPESRVLMMPLPAAGARLELTLG